MQRKKAIKRFKIPFSTPSFILFLRTYSYKQRNLEISKYLSTVNKLHIYFINLLLLSQYCSSPHCAQRRGLACPHWQPFLTQHAQLESSKSCGQVHPEAFSVHRSICSETKNRGIKINLSLLGFNCAI